MYQIPIAIICSAVLLYYTIISILYIFNSCNQFNVVKHITVNNTKSYSELDIAFVHENRKYDEVAHMTDSEISSVARTFNPYRGKLYNRYMDMWNTVGVCSDLYKSLDIENHFMHFIDNYIENSPICKVKYNPAWFRELQPVLYNIARSDNSTVIYSGKRFNKIYQNVYPKVYYYLDNAVYLDKNSFKLSVFGKLENIQQGSVITNSCFDPFALILTNELVIRIEEGICKNKVRVKLPDDAVIRDKGGDITANKVVIWNK